MAVQMPLPNRISQDYELTVTQNVYVSEFNDGYTETAANGPNSIRSEYSITWTPLNLADRNIVTSALRRGIVEQILWTPPGETAQKKFKIVAASGKNTLYVERQSAGMYYTITTQVKQVY